MCMKFKDWQKRSMVVKIRIMVASEWEGQQIRKGHEETFRNDGIILMTEWRLYGLKKLSKLFELYT